MAELKCMGSQNLANLLQTLSSEGLPWLDTKQEGSVIYVSFGSLTGLHEKQQKKILQGLSESGRPFLLVIRSLGGEEMKAMKEEWSENGLMMVSWCSPDNKYKAGGGVLGTGVRAMINDERVEGNNEIKIYIHNEVRESKSQ
ncbi:hypothetical protein RJ640_026068 [Escallonia rubra]|uniref:Uncharacterized protein n=1 Tax=Escallonia rubra TaxID=112253 RepID=A0AA88RXN2_9ASTE|nr:hypothetical protein RJ640_026068 [Escallonia rubra]